MKTAVSPRKTQQKPAIVYIGEQDAPTTQQFNFDKPLQCLIITMIDKLETIMLGFILQPNLPQTWYFDRPLQARKIFLLLPSDFLLISLLNNPHQRL